MASNKDHQDRINVRMEECLRRVRNARNVGLSTHEIIESLYPMFTHEELYLAWKGACVLDGEGVTDPTDKLQVVK